MLLPKLLHVSSRRRLMLTRGLLQLRERVHLPSCRGAAVKATGALAQKIAGHELVLGRLRGHVPGIDYHTLHVVLMHSWWRSRYVAHRCR